jgi:ABC-type nickel/cobalt efflux system permease component RcnA
MAVEPLRRAQIEHEDLPQHEADAARAAVSPVPLDPLAAVFPEHREPPDHRHDRHYKCSGGRAHVRYMSRADSDIDVTKIVVARRATV